VNKKFTQKPWKKGKSLDSAVNLYEADLHCHTTSSDGLLSPTELVQLAAKLGLKGIGITDHDTIHGWKEAEEAGAAHQITILKGIELNTNWENKEVHILGYEMDSSSKYFIDKLKGLRNAREKRIVKILDRLRNLGINLSIDEVQQFAQGESIGRPHIGQALVKRGYVTSIQEGFERYIGLGAPAYVPSLKLTPEEGIRLIRGAHGIAVLAHPGVLRLEEGVPAWVKAGLQGIEVRHSQHKPDDEKRYFKIAQEYGLLTTGGSDFHGEACKPGVNLGGWGVSMDVIKQILILKRHN
jgi:predicted metal-dependent phosphoesterase TrpH